MTGFAGELHSMKKYIANFHYLTQDLPDRTHLQQTELACQGGANWIQYRCLSKDGQELIDEINAVASVCDDWGSTLILTEHFHLLDQVDAQGVHLEDMNADFKAVRLSIGVNKTLGASANSFEDILRIAETGVVDYIGCGPYALTLTKPNDYPLLGVEGYRRIIKLMEEHQITLPLLAVGGITPADAEPLLETGIYGMAVSAAVNKAADPQAALKDFYKKMPR